MNHTFPRRVNLGSRVTSAASRRGQLAQSLMTAALIGLFLALSVRHAAAAVACVPAPGGLVGWWRAESNAVDVINGNNGVLVNGAGYAPGEVGSAFRFSALNHSVQIFNAPALNPTNGMTLEAWVFVAQYPGNDGVVVVGKDWPWAQRQYMIALNWAGNRWSFRPHVGLSSGLVYFDGGASVQTNTWYHVAMTHDNTTLRLYVNGVVDGSQAAAGPMIVTPNPLVIGGFGEAPWTLLGRVDELALYNRALSQSEIGSVFDAGGFGKCAPPVCTSPPSGQVSWWRAESNALDSMDGNNGTLAGNVTYGAGRIGNGFVLDGNRDGVLVGTATNLQLQDFSIESWIRRTSPSVISFNGNGGAQIFALGAGGGGFGFYLRPDAALALGKLQVNEATSGVSITDTNWHHVAVTKSGTTVVFYVDGVAYPAAAYNSGGLTYSGPGYIGAWRNPSALVDNSFYGTIDELGFFGRALTPAEITSIFDASITGKCPPPPPCVAAPAGLVAWWPGNSNAVDVVGTNRGTLLNGAGYAPGQAGPAFSFTALDQSVRIPNAPALNPTNGLTLEGWVYVSQYPANDGVVIAGKDAPFATRQYLIALNWTGTRWSFRPHVTVPSGLKFFDGATAVQTGAWYHVAMTYNNSALQLYVNGVLDGTLPVAGIVTPTPNPMNIGGFGTAPWTLPGRVDELSLYNRALTPNEMLGIYSARSSGKCLPPNRPPQADPQSVSLPEDSSRAIVLTGSDPDGDPLSFTIVNGPTNGTLTGTAPNLVYTPTPNYFGPDSFRFRVGDGQTSSPPATVSINVLNVNDAPVAYSQSVAIDEDTPLAITLTAFDADGDTLTYGLTAPLHGSVTGAPPNLTYTPNTNYHGPDSFTFNVSDALTNSNTATISINVRSVNDAPIARIEVSPLTQVLGITNQVVVAAVCGDATVILDGTSSSDVENDPLTYEWTEGTNSLGATVIVTNQFAVGTHEVTLTVNDGALDGTANQIVEVVSPAQGLGIIIAYIEQSNLGRANGRPLIASLKNAAASFDDCRTIAGVNQLEAFQNKVRAQIAPADADLAARLIEAAQQIIDAVQAAPSE